MCVCVCVRGVRACVRVCAHVCLCVTVRAQAGHSQEVSESTKGRKVLSGPEKRCRKSVITEQADKEGKDKRHGLLPPNLFLS